VKFTLPVLLLFASAAQAQHKPWAAGSRGVGATAAPITTPTLTTRGSQACTNVAANGTCTVASVTTPGASLIVIGAQGAGRTVQGAFAGVAVNGNAAARAVTVNSGAAFGVSEIWTYWSPAALSAVNVVVTNSSAGVIDAGVWVLDATSSGTPSAGATNSASANSGAPSVSVTTTVNSSVVVAAMATFSQAAFSPGANTAEYYDFVEGQALEHACEYNTQTTTSGNPYTVAATTTSGWWMASAVEIKP